MTQLDKENLNTRPQLFLISVICFASLGYAFHLQTSQDLPPCLICVIGRYIILATGLLSLIAFLFTLIKTKATHIIAKVLHILTYPIVLTGVYYVYKHYKSLKEQSNACIIDPLHRTLDNLPTVKWWPEFFQIKGNCTDIQSMLHGIPLYLTPLIVYCLFIFFSYWYLMYDNYMFSSKMKSEEVGSLD